ncbi:polysaccharide deacetylase family protein [Frankia tisae]|uniref:polysaccharide deacetylase family protein n=1 Tax=Frankia tisae TaxID=2950104 RepID=UPI0021C1E1E3|nr:polysaccharide deacetylase family protein [Frankia tisae]
MTLGLRTARREQMIPVLRYRSLDPHTTRGAPRRPMPFPTFARHCRLIAAAGRQPMTVSGYVASLGVASAPKNPLVITFDDGGAETMNALRCLAEWGLTATVFVTSSRVGDPGYFHRADLHRIRGLGIEIGGSGHTGRPLNELARTDVIAELTLSRRRLAVAIGDEPRTFAYPGGGYDLSVRQLVISAGYSSACAVRDMLSHPADDRFALARLTVDATTPDSRLQAWLEGVGRSEPHPAPPRGHALRLPRVARSTGPFRPRLGRSEPRLPEPAAASGAIAGTTVIPSPAHATATAASPDSAASRDAGATADAAAASVSAESETVRPAATRRER